MKKITLFIVFGVFLSLGLVSGAAADHHGDWHGHGGVYWGWYGGPGWWGYPYAYPYYPYYPYPNAYSYPAYPSDPPVVQSQPQQYYWYYCRDAKAYYPYVTSCPGGWTPVVPNPPQAGNGGQAQ